MFTNLISPERTHAHHGDSTMKFGPRRAGFVNAAERMFEEGWPLDEATVEQCEAFDLVYRTLCAILYNYVPLSGHPGGSISSGRFVARLLFDTMDYDLALPNRQDADIISYAAGHKALGLYAMWALRNEVARIAGPDLLPHDEKFQLRLEDLLGFRRNPTTATPLFRKFHAKPLDGHPTPATPFVRLSTGASGVGVPASFGLAWAAGDLYRDDPPRIHIIEGEGGMTPGRVAEAFAAAATASLDNIILHIDWNQASIDSNHVCRDGESPGEYVQWTPAELAYLHDWNVVYVPDGFDWQQIATAQRAALDFQNGQPTAIVYRTVKGWQYGIEGRASHGAGHGLCSSAVFAAVAPLLPKDMVPLPCCEGDKQRCRGGADATVVEECYWKTLSIIRRSMEASLPMVEALAARLRAAQERLNARGRKPSDGRPHLHHTYTIAERASDSGTPSDLRLKAGSKITLREQLGRVLNYYNVATDGAFIVAAADLLGSTSINKANDKFPGGFYNRLSNADAREIAMGGICEDAMMAMLSGGSVGFMYD